MEAVQVTLMAVPRSPGTSATEMENGYAAPTFGG